EYLVVESVERSACRHPAPFRAAKEERPGCECQQKHDHIDKCRKSESEDVAACGGGHQFLKRDQKILLAAGSLIHEIFIAGGDWLVERRAIERLRGIAPRDCVVNPPERAKLLFACFAGLQTGLKSGERLRGRS